jgi:uncharacterized protein YqeY
VSISEQLTADMATSMKAGTTERTGVVRLLRSSLKNEEIKVGHLLGDDEVLKVLQREAKQRRDSIEAFTSAGRTKLAATESTELAIITGYLPQPMTETEITKVVDQVIASQNASDMKAMGAVIGAVMSEVGARAEGGVVSRIVKSRLVS